MSWRVVDAGGYARYATVCGTCGLLRGWETKQRAQVQVSDLAAVGHDPERLRVEEYPDGTGDTCPHGVSLDRPLPPKRPKR